MNDSVQTATPADDFEVESSSVPVAPVPVQARPEASVEATTEADDALSADPGDDDGQLEAVDATEEQPKPHPRSLQAKINKEVALRREAERRAEAAEQRAREYEARQAAPKPAEQAPKPQQAQYTRPKPSESEIGEKYADYPAYIEDLADWKWEQRDAERQQVERQRAVYQRHEATAQQFAAKIAKAEETDPDYWSKIDPAVANLRPSSTLQPGERPTALNAIADIIFDSEQSTELMARLTRAELQRLSTLPPSALFREMGKLEASLSRPVAASSGPAPKTPVISQAPPPIKPVGTTASAGEVDPLSDDLDVDTHIRVMNARDRKRASR